MEFDIKTNLQNRFFNQNTKTRSGEYGDQLCVINIKKNNSVGIYCSLESEFSLYGPVFLLPQPKRLEP